MTSRCKFINAFIILFVFIFLFSNCTDSGTKGTRTTVSGSFPAFKGKSLTISEFDINSAIPIDTVKIGDDGSFKFKFNRQHAGFYLLKIDNRNFLTLVLDKEKKVKVFSDGDNLKKGYTVEGSVDSELYRDFEINLEINRGKVDSLSKTYKDSQRSNAFRSIQMSLDKRYQEIFASQRENSMLFLDEHCSSLASLLVINRRFGEKKIIDEENDFAYFLKLDSCLSLKYPDNKHLAEHKRKLDRINEQRRHIEMTEKRLAPGNKVPDIGLQDPSGKEIQLYSLQGKPVILYFWASWDKESRKSNKIIKDMVEKKGRDKPNVYAVGLESYKEVWAEAIKTDGLQDWKNVTDLLNIHSSAKTLFNIPDKFPYFILLDKELIIRYRGNNFDELAAEIEKY
jgi:thiol-disulfide isomerase/thioredoxin